MQKLNDQQVVCVAQYDKVLQAEASMLQAVRDIQPYLVNLVKERMSRIEQKSA
ncbi:hypothetical protein OL548_25310 [Lysinibacillus sp. MHQ-1]|nr:hypothetical protein OL548_25310 [Lysinibacillus sp. MHQ-1]